MSTEIQKEARKLAAQEGVKIIYRNTKGEYFTSWNLAMLSVNQKADEIEKFDFSDSEAETDKKGKASDSEKKPTKKELQTALAEFKKQYDILQGDMNKEELKDSPVLQQQLQEAADNVKKAEEALAAFEKK